MHGVANRELEFRNTVWWIRYRKLSFVGKKIKVYLKGLFIGGDERLSHKS